MRVPIYSFAGYKNVRGRDRISDVTTLPGSLCEEEKIILTRSPVIRKKLREICCEIYVSREINVIFFFFLI